MQILVAFGQLSAIKNCVALSEEVLIRIRYIKLISITVTIILAAIPRYLRQNVFSWKCHCNWHGFHITGRRRLQICRVSLYCPSGVQFIVGWIVHTWVVHSCKQIVYIVCFCFCLIMSQTKYGLHDDGTYHIGNQRRLRQDCLRSLRCSHTWSVAVDEGSDQKSDI